MTAIQILMYEGVDELDAVGPFEFLRAAGLEVRLVVATEAGTPAPDEIRGGHGLRMRVDGTLDETAGAGGVVIVPGGGWVKEDGGVRRALAVGVIAPAVARMHAGGATVASVCTGAVLLAATGLLEGRPAITHRAAIGYLREHGADVREEARVVDDGDLLTAGGVTSGLDLALHLVERLLGAEAARAGAIRAEHEPSGRVLVTATR